MWYSDHHGVIRTPKEFTINGATYPRQVFRKWDKAKLAELGITPARVETPDSRYYNTGAETLTLVDGETVISYATTEKDVEGLKKALISKIKQNVGNILSNSDWRVIREADGGAAMSDAWKTFRNEAVKNFQNHDIIEVRYVSTYDAEGNETIGPETRNHNISVDKTHWGWPVSPDAEVDPRHVEYK